MLERHFNRFCFFSRIQIAQMIQPNRRIRWFAYMRWVRRMDFDTFQQVLLMSHLTNISDETIAMKQLSNQKCSLNET